MTLVTGTGLGLGLTVLARPILTRLYTPEDFGLLGFFLAVSALLSTVSTGRYEDALLTPEDKREAANVLALSGLLALGTAGISLFFLVWRMDLALFLGEPAIAPFLGLVAPTVLALSWARISEIWLTRGDHFTPVSRARIVQSGVAAPLQITAGWAKVGAGGLVYGLLAGQLAAAVYLLARMLRLDRSVFSAVERKGIRAAVRRFRRFPQFSLPAALLNASALHLPSLLLFGFYDAGVVGFYAQAYGLLAAPIGLVGSSVTQVFFVRAAESQRAGRLGADTEAVLTRLARLGLFPLLSLCLVGPDVFDIVLGAAFREAGEYTRFLAPWVLILFVSSPLTRLYDVLERQRSFFVYNVISFTARLSALLFAGSFLDARSAIALYAVVGAGLSGGQTLWLLRIGRADFRAVALSLSQTAAASLPGLALLYVLSRSGASAMVVVAGAACLVAVYLGLFFRRERRID
jgi:lipopolysaccharide exporter